MLPKYAIFSPNTNSLTSFLPCHSTDLLLPFAVKCDQQLFILLFLSVIFLEVAIPLPLSHWEVALKTCHLSCKSLLWWKKLGLLPSCSSNSNASCKNLLEQYLSSGQLSTKSRQKLRMSTRVQANYKKSV